jgi:hypothetical protein
MQRAASTRARRSTETLSRRSDWVDDAWASADAAMLGGIARNSRLDTLSTTTATAALDSVPVRRRSSSSKLAATEDVVERTAKLVEERVEQRINLVHQHVDKLSVHLAEIAKQLAEQRRRPPEFRTTTEAHPWDVQRLWLAKQEERISAHCLHQEEASDMAVSDVTTPARCRRTDQTANPALDSNMDSEEPPPAARSLASFCVEQAMAPLGPTAGGFVATLQMIAMTCFQYILAHGFFDSVWLDDTVKNFAPFAEPIQTSEFYIMRPCPDCSVPFGFDRTFVFGQCATDQTTCPERHSRMKVLTSLAAMVLLASGPLLMDDTQTLVTKQPLDYLMFDERLVHVRQQQPSWRAKLCFLWRLATALVLQACWATRVLLIPAFCIVGTAVALADASSVVDSVLNGVAIGFVYAPSARPGSRSCSDP